MAAGLRQDFAAPWGRLLRAMTLLSALLLAGVALAVLLLEDDAARWWILALPLGVLPLAALFMVRGYRVTADGLEIGRPGWRSRVPLGPAATAEVDTQALDGAIRLFANGGLFTFAGWFRSRRLGSFRAWVNDPVRSVIVRDRGRAWVVSPDDPAAFVQAMAQRCATTRQDRQEQA
jgi:hypothetical protein